MKKFLFFILVCLEMISIASGQVPQAFKYQSVIRKNNVPLANKLVRIKTSILQSSASGLAVFSQIDTVTTSSFGLANLLIGAGSTGLRQFAEYRLEFGSLFH